MKEPCFEKATGPDPQGLWLDKRRAYRASSITGSKPCDSDAAELASNALHRIRALGSAGATVILDCPIVRRPTVGGITRGKTSGC